jgi:large subunit ribosomal protein L3
MFRADGQVVPVTLLKAGPCMVVQRKTPATEGYDAVQLGLVEFVKPQRINKPTTGHLKKAGVEGAKFLREFRLRAGDDDFKPGDQVLVDQFKPKDKVDVIGISKGKGFAGVVKRHHFRGGEGSHGSMFHRAPGSIGASSFPSRVLPGMRMGGHMGNEQVTVRNLEIVDVDTEDNVLAVKGAVPGPNGGYVLVRRSKR